MSATWELFQRWMAAKGHSSPRQGALALKLDPSTATLWKKGGNAQAAVIWEMAEAVNDDPAIWLARVECEKARSEADRKAWRALTKRLGAAAAVAAVALIFRDHPAVMAFVLALPEPAQIGGIMRSVPLAALALTAALGCWAAIRSARHDRTPALLD